MNATKARIECARLLAAVAAGKAPGEYVTDETYHVAGIGWCGPGWQSKTKAEALRCHFGECGAPRCTGCGVTLTEAR